MSSAAVKVAQRDSQLPRLPSGPHVSPTLSLPVRQRSESAHPMKEHCSRDEEKTLELNAALQALVERDVERRVREAVRERDETWRRHEKQQIVFLQNESAAMLRGLHGEVERLQNELRDAHRQLYCESPSERVKREEGKRVTQLEEQLKRKEQHLADMEKKVTATMERMNEQLQIQGDRIRQLTGELHDRTQTVAHLSTQLRSYRLKEAMATAHRRRSATGEMSPTSPSASPRFPANSPVKSASVRINFGPAHSDSAHASIERPAKLNVRRKPSFGN